MWWFLLFVMGVQAQIVLVRQDLSNYVVRNTTNAWVNLDAFTHIVINTCNITMYPLVNVGCEDLGPNRFYDALLAPLSYKSCAYYGCGLVVVETTRAPLNIRCGFQPADWITANRCYYRFSSYNDQKLLVDITTLQLTYSVDYSKDASGSCIATTVLTSIVVILYSLLWFCISARNVSRWINFGYIMTGVITVIAYNRLLLLAFVYVSAGAILLYIGLIIGNIAWLSFLACKYETTYTSERFLS